MPSMRCAFNCSPKCHLLVIDICDNDGRVLFCEEVSLRRVSTIPDLLGTMGTCTKTVREVTSLEEQSLANMISATHILSALAVCLFGKAGELVYTLGPIKVSNVG